MLRFIVRRLLLLVPILLGLSLMLFLWVHNLPGGTAEAILGEKATPEKIAQFISDANVDQEEMPAYSELTRRLGFEYNGMVHDGRPPPFDDIIGHLPGHWD